MWRIKHIFDGEYGCEEYSGAGNGMVSLTLQDETGKEKYALANDNWLRSRGLEEGSVWPYLFWGNEQAAKITRAAQETEQASFEAEAVQGTEDAAVAAGNDEYKGIDNPFDLYDALSDIWCAETCAPRMRENWSKENKTLGQCSITAFLAQDIFGGKVCGILRSGGNYHCYNVIGDTKFDLTSEQFGEEILKYENNPEQLREVHFAKEEKWKRYEYLKAQLRKYCDECKS